MSIYDAYPDWIQRLKNSCGGATLSAGGFNKDQLIDLAKQASLNHTGSKDELLQILCEHYFRQTSTISTEVVSQHIAEHMNLDDLLVKRTLSKKDKGVADYVLTHRYNDLIARDPMLGLPNQPLQNIISFFKSFEQKSVAELLSLINPSNMAFIHNLLRDRYKLILGSYGDINNIISYLSCFEKLVDSHKPYNIDINTPFIIHGGSFSESDPEVNRDIGRELDIYINNGAARVVLSTYESSDDRVGSSTRHPDVINGVLVQQYNITQILASLARNVFLLKLDNLNYVITYIYGTFKFVSPEPILGIINHYGDDSAVTMITKTYYMIYISPDIIDVYKLSEICLQEFPIWWSVDPTKILDTIKLFNTIPEDVRSLNLGDVYNDEIISNNIISQGHHIRIRPEYKVDWWDGETYDDYFFVVKSGALPYVSLPGWEADSDKT
jgi:hypothetical protein